jgi:hypothetical protein
MQPTNGDPTGHSGFACADWGTTKINETVATTSEVLLIIENIHMPFGGPSRELS